MLVNRTEAKKTQFPDLEPDQISLYRVTFKEYGEGAVDTETVYMWLPTDETARALQLVNDFKDHQASLTCEECIPPEIISVTGAA